MLGNLCGELFVLSPASVKAPDWPERDKSLETDWDGIGVEKVARIPRARCNHCHTNYPQGCSNLGDPRASNDGGPEHSKGDGVVDEEEEEDEVDAATGSHHLME
jgi:hypothetical protein